MRVSEERDGKWRGGEGRGVYLIGWVGFFLCV